jgi:outer membrane lipoprotein-sorting protein
MVLPVKDAGMNPTRFVFVIVAGCCLLCSEPLPAQEAPFDWGKPFSADMVMTTAKGLNFTQKMYGDGGKMRTEVSMNGRQMVTIVRPDLQKLYQVSVDQKMVVETTYDPSKSKSPMAAASGPHGKFELIGPDMAEGAACMKYKVTSNASNKVSFMWVDAATKAPVKMVAEDGSFTMLWKNYKAGPQDPALFEVPAGYKVMSMQSTPGGAGQ